MQIRFSWKFSYHWTQIKCKNSSTYQENATIEHSKWPPHFFYFFDFGKIRPTKGKKYKWWSFLSCIDSNYTKSSKKLPLISIFGNPRWPPRNNGFSDPEDLKKSRCLQNPWKQNRTLILHQCCKFEKNPSRTSFRRSWWMFKKLPKWPFWLKIENQIYHHLDLLCKNYFG